MSCTNMTSKLCLSPCFHRAVTAVLLILLSLQTSVASNTENDYVDGTIIKKMADSVEEELFREEEEWFINGEKSKIYSYDPSSHWDTNSWKFIPNDPYKPFRTCVIDDETRSLRSPFMYRGLAKEIEVRMAFMFEEPEGTTHNLDAWFESGVGNTGVIDLNPTRNPNVTGQLEEKVNPKFWYQYAMSFEFNETAECGIRLSFSVTKSCVSVCCMHVFAIDPEPVIVPTYLGLNCTIKARNRCIPQVNFRFFWYHNHPVETVHEDMAVYETSKDTNSTFWCRVYAGEFQHNSRKTWRSKEFFVGKKCPIHSTEANCCELEGDYCPPGNITQF